MTVNLKQISGIILNNPNQVWDCYLTLFYKVAGNEDTVDGQNSGN